MTAIAIIPRPDSIFVATDSLLQKIAHGDYEKADIIGNTIVQKLFCIPKAATVVVGIGRSTLNGQSIRQILSDVIIGGKSVIANHSSFVQAFGHHLSALAVSGTTFYAVGFERENPYVHEIELLATSPPRAQIRLKYDGNGNGILGWCAKSTSDWYKNLGLDFCKLDEAEIVSFVDKFFQREVELAKNKTHPDVGEPIDIVSVTAQGISPIRIRDRQAAFLNS